MTVGAESIVNTLSKAWDIIKGSEPQADITSESCNAVPQVDDWTNLHEGGHAAAAWRTIKVTSPLGLGTYVDILYHLSYTYGATYKDGGAYIASCAVNVERCYVEWPFDVTVKFTVLETNNAGTHNAPVAHLRVRLSESWTNHIQKESRTRIYNLYGDGRPPVEE